LQASTKHIGKSQFKVDDKVIISRIKGTFEKGYLPNWFEANYLIHEIKQTNPVTYMLKDTLGELIEGSFYKKELKKMNQEIYRIEKVLRKKILMELNMLWLNGWDIMISLMNRYRLKIYTS